MIELSPIPATGGPAFPLYSHGTQTLGLNVTGMSLRDYFAAKAMQSLILEVTDWKYMPNKIANFAYANEIANFAYAQADAMLKARTT